MLKLWNIFSDIPAKLKYFLNFTQGVKDVCKEATGKNGIVSKDRTQSV